MSSTTDHNDGSMSAAASTDSASTTPAREPWEFEFKPGAADYHRGSRSHAAYALAWLVKHIRPEDEGRLHQAASVADIPAHQYHEFCRAMGLPLLEDEYGMQTSADPAKPDGYNGQPTSRYILALADEYDWPCPFRLAEEAQQKAVQQAKDAEAERITRAALAKAMEPAAKDQPWAFTDRRNKPTVRLENAVIGMRKRPKGIPQLGFDDALGEVVILDGGRGRPLSDTDRDQWQMIIERDGDFTGNLKPVMSAAVDAVAREHTFDSLQDWLGGLQWDGKPRIARFVTAYLNVAESAYSQAVGLYWWTALAGRVLAPGCQVDMVPLLIGREGTGKTRSVQATAPWPDAFTSIDMASKPDDLARRVRGVVAAEWSELRGLRNRDEEMIKDYVTRAEEHWVPKYREHAVRYPRRFVLVGTSNDRNCLPSYGDARRWLPLRIEQQIDVGAIHRDRDQLWAEAREFFRVWGVQWQELDALAPAERDRYREEDILRELVLEWLDAPVTGLTPEGFTTQKNRETEFAIRSLVDHLKAKGETVHVKRLSMMLQELGYHEHQTGKAKLRRWFRANGQA